MEYRVLGGTGINVSKFCLGAMMFGEEGNPDHDECIRMVHTALDAGINFIDTADRYSYGESEEIVGKALKGRRDEVVLATKVFGRMGDDPNSGGTSRRWIIREIEASLRRLNTDHIDLYQLHNVDPKTDIEETLSALTDLIHQGKVRAIGTSKFPVEQIVEAQWVSERRGFERFRCEQLPYSIFARGVETAILPTCTRYKMGVIVWSPLSGGWLTGRYRHPEDVDITSGRAGRMPDRYTLDDPGNRAKLDRIAPLEKIAADANMSLVNLALAFVVNHPSVTAAIIGPRTPEQLDQILAGESMSLNDEILDRIDELVEPGTNLNRIDGGVILPVSLTDPRTRRRTASH